MNVNSVGALFIALLYILNDKSPDFQDTWSYLHRRMNDARALHRVNQSLEHAVGDGLKVLNAGVTTGFATIQNLLGVGRRDR